MCASLPVLFGAILQMKYESLFCVASCCCSIGDTLRAPPLLAHFNVFLIESCSNGLLMLSMSTLLCQWQ